MRFHDPILLLFLFLVPALVWLRHRRSRQATLAFSDARVLKSLPVTWAILAQPVLPILFGIGLTLLVIAMARPQRGLSEDNVKTEGVDIVLLVDVSTSMRAVDLSESGRQLNRLDAAKMVIERFIKKRENDRIGIVAFSALPYTFAPLTLDHAWLLERLASIQTGMLEDGTAIGDAIAAAINRLRDSKAKSKLVILLTDGQNNMGDLSPDNAAEAAKALGIKIYTVGAGSTGDVLVPVQDPFGRTQYARTRADVDDAGLTRVAETTGAKYFRATDFETLEKTYNEIDRLEKTEMDVEHFTRYEERFAPWLCAGLACLAMERLLSLYRLGRLP